jgi:Cyclin, N-terminal domain
MLSNSGSGIACYWDVTPGSYGITEAHRDVAACRILDLCHEKGYRKETHLLAVSILDRYLSRTFEKMSPNQLPLLVTTATILAAKLEQPMTPSIKRMIKLLTQEEQALVEKEGVIWLEQQVLTLLQFDFNHPSSLTFLERFGRITSACGNISSCL